MQGIFQKENTDKALKYGIYRHLPTYEKIIRNLVSFSNEKSVIVLNVRKHSHQSLIILIVFNKMKHYRKLRQAQVMILMYL